MKASTPAPELPRKLDAWWRAANFLSVGQIYLYGNPMLKQPLKQAHIKPRRLGQWDATPGLNFVYAYLNRVIKARDLNAIYISGPGAALPILHLIGYQIAGPAVLARIPHDELERISRGCGYTPSFVEVDGIRTEGTMNDLDRFHLVADGIDRVPALGPRAARAKQAIRDKLIERKQYIAQHGEDLPEIRNCKGRNSK